MAMNKVDYEQLLNQARVTLVGASDTGLKGAFYDVLSEFFNDSSCWTSEIPFNAVPTTRSYSVQVNEGQIIRLAGVFSVTEGCQFIPALMPNIGQIDLGNAPNTAITYTAVVVTNVALPVDKNQMPQAPDWVLPVWHVGILDGLLGKMMIQPSKSYANLAQGAYHLKRFRDAIARARVSKLRANTNGAIAWRFPQSFRSASQQGGVPATSGGSDRRF